MGKQFFQEIHRCHLFVSNMLFVSAAVHIPYKLKRKTIQFTTRDSCDCVHESMYLDVYCISC